MKLTKMKPETLYRDPSIVAKAALKALQLAEILQRTKL